MEISFFLIFSSNQPFFEVSLVGCAYVMKSEESMWKIKKGSSIYLSYGEYFKYLVY